MNRVFVIIGLVILGIGLVYLNQGISKTAPTEDAAEQTQREQEQVQSDAQQKAITAQATPSGPETALPSEETIGNPASAQHHIEVGWIYNEDNLKNPETLFTPIQTIRDFVNQQGGTTSAEIVDLDIPSVDRSPAARAVTDLGLHIDGTYVYNENISDQAIRRAGLMEMLTMQANKKPPVKK